MCPDNLGFRLIFAFPGHKGLMRGGFFHTVIRGTASGCCFCLLVICLGAGSSPVSGNRIRTVFYNVENFFDTEDDPGFRDEEFLPESIRHWSLFRYKRKRRNIYKALAGAGGWGGADIIGLCEVENSGVLEDLTRNTPLSKYRYRYLHRDSPDPRGIDVALVYKKEVFIPLHHEVLRVGGHDGRESWRSRDILYAKGLIRGPDTLHIFVNHWPSRRGGVLHSAPRRKYAALILRAKLDSLWACDRECRILVMGDFNDEPEDHSIQDVLLAEKDARSGRTLINLCRPEDAAPAEGSIKYRGLWYRFDQVMVSAPLAQSACGESCRVYAPFFLLTGDSRYTGHRPCSTYRGYRYEGGFSDHLPVVADFYRGRHHP